MTSESLFRLLFTGGTFLLFVSFLMLRIVRRRWWAVFSVLFSILFFIISIFAISLSIVVRNSYITRDGNPSFYMERVDGNFLFSVKDRNERFFLLPNPPVIYIWSISIANLKVVKLAEISPRFKFVTHPEEISFNIITWFSKFFHFIKWDKKRIPFIESEKRMTFGFSVDGKVFLK